MMQTDEGLTRLRQKTPDARGETITGINCSPPPFTLNQNNTVCLPLVADGQRLIWVHSSQIDLKLDGVAELEKAFDRFPYLTQKQTDTLAQRSSLHPDQVRVWFMVRRLHYGISWDYKDIRKVRGMMEENGQTAERPESEMKREKDTKVEEDQMNSGKKRKSSTGVDKKEQKRIKQGDEAVVESKEEVEMRGCEQRVDKECQNSLFARKKKKAKQNKRLLCAVQESSSHETFNVPPLTDNQTGPAKAADVDPPSAQNIRMSPVKSDADGIREKEEEPHAELPNLNNAVTDVGKLQELMAMNANPLLADSPSTSTQQHVYQTVVPGSLPLRARYKTKTQSQLAKMKVAFTRSQYPDEEEYTQLSAETGVRRYMLVQWYGDMRYYIKKGKPRWMTKDQHSQALATVLYRQCLNGFAKMAKSGSSKSTGEGENVPGPQQ